jgi:hypothetical protein
LTRTLQLAYGQRSLIISVEHRPVKRRGDRFESDDQLYSWLDEDQVSYTSESLSAALHQRERIGSFAQATQGSMAI